MMMIMFYVKLRDNALLKFMRLHTQLTRKKICTPPNGVDLIFNGCHWENSLFSGDEIFVKRIFCLAKF